MSMKEKRTKNTKNSRKDSISQNLTSAKQAGINNQCSINNIVAVPGRVWHIGISIVHRIVHALWTQDKVEFLIIYI